MQIYVYIIIGLIFGWLMSYSGLNRFNTIAGMSILKDFTVAKTIMLILAIGAITLMLEMIIGQAEFHVKPLYLFATGVGGIIFGCGMSILGYCPGTLSISLGQGSLDAFWGIVGGLGGGIVYTIVYPYISPWFGTDYGKESVYTLMGSSFSAKYIIVVCAVSVALTALAILFHHIDVKRGNPSLRWILTAIGIALLNTLLFYNGWLDTPLGASSAFPFVGDTIAGLTRNDYFSSISDSGYWEMWFLLGAMIAGFLQSLVTKTFDIRLIQKLWKDHRGNSKGIRIMWALIGGFILIFGARLAGGCTSGHIISGGMQMAISSYIFALFTFIGFLVTGQLFYKYKMSKRKTDY